MKEPKGTTGDQDPVFEGIVETATVEGKLYISLESLLKVFGSFAKRGTLAIDRFTQRGPNLPQ